MTVDEKNLCRQFEKTIKVPRQKLRPPLMIGLFGKIGSGKSTVAQLIAKKIPVVVLRTDIPRTMIIKKFGHKYNTIKRVKRIVSGTVLDLLGQNISVLIDAGNLGQNNRQSFVRLAKKHKTKMIWLHITCPESEILRRINKRQHLKDGLLEFGELADVKLYFNRKKIYEKNKKKINYFATINTNKPLASQINKLVKRLI
ncbi:AAA family ATPase [Patescibacteria group bacterium]